MDLVTFSFLARQGSPYFEAVRISVVGVQRSTVVAEMVQRNIIAITMLCKNPLHLSGFLHNMVKFSPA